MSVECDDAFRQTRHTRVECGLITVEGVDASHCKLRSVDRNDAVVVGAHGDYLANSSRYDEGSNLLNVVIGLDKEIPPRGLT